MATATLELTLTKEQKKLHKLIKKSTEKKGAEGAIVVPGSEDVNALYNAQLIDAVSVEGDDSKAKVWFKADLPTQETSKTELVVPLELEEGFPAPAEALRGGRKPEQYPFSKMKIGDSFLIPVTEKHPTPWESFASTVTSANRRFSTASTTEFTTNRKGVKVAKRIYTRKWTLRRVNKGDQYPNGKVEVQTGARIYCIVPPAEKK